MWVVKIGGSLSHDPTLRDWLTELCEVGGGRVVIVPGGAEFADTVRQYQFEWRFDDLAAHNMCLLAMAQYAILMQGVLPELVLASSEENIRRPARRARRRVGADRSDARHARFHDQLGHHVGQPRRVAVDDAQRRAADRREILSDRRRHQLETLAAAGVVDRRFVDYVNDANYVVELFDKNNAALMRDRLLNIPVT